MPIHKKTLLTLLVISSILLVLSALCFLALPPILDSEMVKDRLLSEIQGRTGIQADYSNAVTRFFPIPSVTLQDGTLDTPAKARISFRSLKITPKILPLFVGKLRVAAMQLESPAARIDLPPPSPQDKEEPEGSSSFPDGKQVLSRAGILLSLAIHDISLTVANGEIQVGTGGETLFSMAGMEARFSSRSGKVAFHLNSGSSVWNRLAVDGEFHAEKWTGRGGISLQGFLPETIVPVLFPRLPLGFPRSEINLQAVVEARGPEDFLLTYRASIPAMTLRRGSVEQSLSGRDLEGSVHFRPGKSIDIVLDRAHFDAPRMGLSGRFSVDSTAPSAFLQVKGTDVDAAGFGKVFLLLMGNNRTIQRIFQIIRGGQVPSIEFVSHGRSPRDLHKPENFVIRGSMTNGRILVPNVELDVEEASGEVIVSKAVLEGMDLKGRSGHSLGHSGSLTVGFKRDRYGNAPFKLDIHLDADLEELPPVLRRVVENEGFVHELGLIRKIKGRARGRLLLGESFKSVRTRVEATEFSASARYDRIPYPFDGRGRDFLYEGNRVSVGLLEGSIGNSKLSGVSGSLDWHEESTLKISAASPCAISLEELFSWLVSYENLRESLKNHESLRGFLHLQGLELEGPTRRPLEWKFLGKGTVESFASSSTFAPKPLEIQNGSVEANHDHLMLKDCGASLLDARLMVSGTLRGFWREMKEADLSVSGTVSPAFNQWLTDLVPGKRYVELRSPYTLSQGKFHWSKEDRLGFSGSLTTPDGTSAQLDLMDGPDGFVMREIRVSDEASDAAISLALGDNLLSIGFSGNLANESVNRLLAANPIRSGNLQGNLRAVIALKELAESQVHGDFLIQVFHWENPRFSPLFVDRLSGSAAGNSIKIEESRVAWQGVPMDVSGRAFFSRGACNLDLDLRGKHLEWDTLFPTAEKSRGDSTPQGGDPEKETPRLLGTVRVTADSFTHGKTRWEPFKGSLRLERDGFSVTVADSRFCGIPLQGSLAMSGKDVELKAKPQAKKEDLDATVSCLWNKPDLVKGTYGLTGELEARGTKEILTGEGILRSLKGSLELDAAGGRIYRLGLLSKILSVLNVTEIYRGKLPDLVKEGFEYDTIRGRGVLERGKLHLEEFIIAAPSMKMFWQGEVDLVKNEVDLTLLVAPLRTLDRVIDNVPLVGKLIGGSVISIPVQVTGNADDPAVIPLAPSAVGSKLLRHVRRVFQVPLQVIQPLR